jgi:peptide/nickel transport system permease protein
VAIYTLRRVTLLLPTVLGLVTVVFVLVRVIPGDTVTALMADSGQFSEAQIAQLRSDWRLDEPLHEQYLTYMGGILTGDLGRSFYFNTPVREEIQQRLFPTIEIAVLALGIGILVAIPLGVVASVRRGGAVDTLVRSFAVLGQALPNFWIATLVVSGRI